MTELLAVDGLTYAEQSLLRGLMVLGSQTTDDPLTPIRAIVVAQDFTNAQHAALFQMFCDMQDRGRGLDLISIQAHIDQFPPTHDISIAYCLSLILVDSSSVHTMRHARMVAEASRRRRLAAIGMTLMDHAGTYDIETVIHEASDGLAETVPPSDAEPMPMSASITQSYDALEHPLSAISGVTTGLTHLDRGLGGLKPSSVVVLGARTSVGKSALSHTIAYHAAVRKGKGVLLFSFEMPSRQINDRLIGIGAGINSVTMQTHALSEEERYRAANVTAQLHASALHVYDRPGATVSQVERATEKIHAHHPMDLVIIDYLTLMRAEGGENRTQEVGKMINGLKEMAMRLDVPVLVLAQLNRQVEQRANREPTLSDLRDSGDIEQSADVVILMHRQASYDLDMGDERGKTDLIIAKNRNGPQTRVSIWFEEQYIRFSDMEYSTGVTR